MFPLQTHFTLVRQSYVVSFVGLSRRYTGERLDKCACNSQGLIALHVLPSSPTPVRLIVSFNELSIYTVVFCGKKNLVGHYRRLTF